MFAITPRALENKKKVPVSLYQYFLHIILTLELLLFSYFIYYHRTETPIFFNRFQMLRSMVLGVLTINITVFFLRAVTRGNAWARRITGFIILCAVALFAFYHDLRATEIDLSMMVDNINIAFNAEAMAAISRILNPEKVLLLIAFTGLFFSIDIFLHHRATARPARVPKGVLRNKAWRIAIMLIAIGVYSAVILSREVVIDEWTMFIQKAVHHGITLIRERQTRPVPIAVEPRIRTRGDMITGLTPWEKPPSIIILMVESFNTDYVERSLDNGTEITPNFNRLIPRGFYASRFYSNSIQTSKGQYAALFSQIPSYEGKVFTSYAEHRFYGLADVLKPRGYRTSLVKAYKNVDFDNTREFLESHGYDNVFSLYDFLSEEDTNDVAGWGPEDSLFYRHLPEIVERATGGTDAPYLLVLHTVMNHAYFDELPADAQKIVPNAATLREHYINSIHVCDAQLPVFLEGIERMSRNDNLIVIITGDHSFPTGNHGIIYNEIGIYDESFRTPFLLLSPGHVAPLRAMRGTYSQLDITPTILDLLGITEVRNTFVGESMLRSDSGTGPIYLIQPYRGNVLISLRYPYRYLFQESSGLEYIFNLASDPAEKKPIPYSRFPQALIKTFRDDIKEIKRRQVLLQNDMLFPD